MKKYRVKYYESELGWGSDAWNTDYNSESSALAAAKECNDKYGGKTPTPSYYIIATYVGEVDV